ncbi:hypothetical protein QCD71_22830 [Sphingomonas sp. PsM26]|nr:hypothetical protein [Sphingomonas sp. PsM26]
MTTIPPAATAQAQGVQTARAENSRKTDALKTRIVTVQARVAEGRRSGKVTRTRAARLTRQVSLLQESMTHLKRKQGFVSAAELASYNGTLGEVDVALDSYGVPRSYGNDGLVAPNGAQ